MTALAAALCAVLLIVVCLFARDRWRTGRRRSERVRSEVGSERVLREDVRLESALREVAVASASGTLDEWALGQLVAERVASVFDLTRRVVAF